MRIRNFTKLATRKLTVLSSLLFVFHHLTHHDSSSQPLAVRERFDWSIFWYRFDISILSPYTISLFQTPIFLSATVSLGFNFRSFNRTIRLFTVARDFVSTNCDCQFWAKWITSQCDKNLWMASINRHVFSRLLLLTTVRNVSRALPVVLASACWCV